MSEAITIKKVKEICTKINVEELLKEVAYAYNNKALIWNPAPAATDRKNRKNQEKQILKEKYEINS